MLWRPGLLSGPRWESSRRGWEWDTPPQLPPLRRSASVAPNVKSWLRPWAADSNSSTSSSDELYFTNRVLVAFRFRLLCPLYRSSSPVIFDFFVIADGHFCCKLSLAGCRLAGKLGVWRQKSPARSRIELLWGSGRGAKPQKLMTDCENNAYIRCLLSVLL